MLRPILGISEPDLERALLRKGVDARAAGGEVCSDCGRHPLVGERVHDFGGRAVCALCRDTHPGEPSGSRIVHHVEHGISVRRLGLPSAA
ncbi:MAG TPA: hypothetical protein VMT10_08050 [Solirubrobacteraceae bacterium]|nr:hypothetical protein [Solirubrobacteraceae bacterium]